MDDEERVEVCAKCGLTITLADGDWISNIDSRWRKGDMVEPQDQPWWICCPGSTDHLKKFPTYGDAYIYDQEDMALWQASQHEPMVALAKLVYEMGVTNDQ